MLVKCRHQIGLLSTGVCVYKGCTFQIRDRTEFNLGIKKHSLLCNWTGEFLIITFSGMWLIMTLEWETIPDICSAHSWIVYFCCGFIKPLFPYNDSSLYESISIAKTLTSYNLSNLLTDFKPVTTKEILSVITMCYGNIPRIVTSHR